ncbi:hypothetical protein IFR05_013641 [Cadophora sp. M221]|nr:hypothetical protein IFR05_013641 [Cadophora sp. M221]
MPLLSIFLAALIAHPVLGGAQGGTNIIQVPRSAPRDSATPDDNYVSYSIEPSSWPDFAGNLSAPNTFSYNLLKNIKQLTGEFPVMRLGGNTQDQIRFDANAKVTLQGVMNPNISSDYPTNIIVGPSYYESYQTFPGVSYIHGFNLGNKTNWPATVASAPYVCKALRGNLDLFSIGNEPDLFWLAGQRDSSYTEAQYYTEWNDMYKALRANMKCDQKTFAPSFAGVANFSLWRLDPLKAWNLLQPRVQDRSIKEFSQHNYMEAATSPGVTLQRTLMNHSNIVVIAEKLNRVFSKINGVPYVIGEHNSLARQGKPGISNSFGAALWGVDFNLYMATQGVKRQHMHQGTNYRYQSWQPVEGKNTKGTKAPYYGNIGVAAFLGGIKSLVNLPLDEMNAAYAGYDGKLKRVILINLNQYNASDWNQDFVNNYPRPVKDFQLDLPCGGGIRRLIANGSDAITGATFDGYSYNWELDNGKPVLLKNVTRGETFRRGIARVSVPYSSVAILDLKC